MSHNQGRLDGFPVEVYDGKFAGTFDMDDEVGETISYDDVVVFMVTAVAGKAAFGATKTGDLKRTNAFDITNVSIVPNELAVKIANSLEAHIDGLNSGQLTLGQEVDTTKVTGIGEPGDSHSDDALKDYLYSAPGDDNEF